MQRVAAKHIALSAAEESVQDHEQNPASCPASNFNLHHSSHVFLFAVYFAIEREREREGKREREREGE